MAKYLRVMVRKTSLYGNRIRPTLPRMDGKLLQVNLRGRVCDNMTFGRQNPVQRAWGEVIKVLGKITDKVLHMSVSTGASITTINLLDRGSTPIPPCGEGIRKAEVCPHLAFESLERGL